MVEKYSTLTSQTWKQIQLFQPPVYRYLDQKWIDEFLTTGRLLISSLRKFIKYPDEVRGDKNEGTAHYHTELNGGSHFVSHLSSGISQYIFCTSLINSDELKSDFGVDSCIRIFKPFEFTIAILNSIANSSGASYGLCNYQDSRYVESMSEKSMVDVVDDFINFSGEQMGNGLDMLFLKENKYQYQNEFRFVWDVNVPYDELPENMIVECKEALKYCEQA